MKFFIEHPVLDNNFFKQLAAISGGYVLKIKISENILKTSFPRVKNAEKHESDIQKIRFLSKTSRLTT